MKEPSNSIFDYLEIKFPSRFTIEPLQEEASTRKYYLIQSNGTRQVLCVDNEINTDFVHLSAFLFDHEIDVPQILSVYEPLGILFMTWEGKADLSTLKLEQYKAKLPAVLDLLLKLQRLNPPDFVSSRKFDSEKLMFEINLTLHMFKKFRDTFEIETNISFEAITFLEETAAYLNKHPVNVFTHRDFHSRNILLNDKSGFTLIDFQDARMGVPQYDLASILYDAYYPLPRELRLEMLASFKSKSIGGNIKFNETFYLQALQRSFKALGTYFRMVVEEHNIKFKPSILVCLQQLEEIIQIGLFPDSLYIFIKSLRDELARHSDFQRLS